MTSLFKTIFEPLTKLYVSKNQTISDIGIIKNDGIAEYAIVETKDGIDVFDKDLKQLFHFDFPYSLWFWDHEDEPVLISQDSKPTTYYMLMREKPVKVKISEEIRYFMTPNGTNRLREPFAIDKNFERVFIFGNPSQVFSLLIDEIKEWLLILLELSKKIPKIHSLYDVDAITSDLIMKKKMTVEDANEITLPSRILFNNGEQMTIESINNIKKWGFWFLSGSDLIYELLFLPKIRWRGAFVEDGLIGSAGLFKPSSLPLPTHGMKKIRMLLK